MREATADVGSLFVTSQRLVFSGRTFIEVALKDIARFSFDGLRGIVIDLHSGHAVRFHVESHVGTAHHYIELAVGLATGRKAQMVSNFQMHLSIAQGIAGECLAFPEDPDSEFTNDDLAIQVVTNLRACGWAFRGRSGPSAVIIGDPTGRSCRIVLDNANDESAHHLLLERVAEARNQINEERVIIVTTHEPQHDLVERAEALGLEICDVSALSAPNFK